MDDAVHAVFQKYRRQVYGILLTLGSHRRPRLDQTIKAVQKKSPKVE